MAYTPKTPPPSPPAFVTPTSPHVKTPTTAPADSPPRPRYAPPGIASRSEPRDLRRTLPNAQHINPLEAFVQTLKAKLARHAPITLDDLKEFEKHAGEVVLKGSQAASIDLPRREDHALPDSIRDIRLYEAQASYTSGKTPLSREQDREAQEHDEREESWNHSVKGTKDARKPSWEK